MILPYQISTLRIPCMAKCFFCGAGTRLYVGNTPVCVECDEKRSERQRKPTVKNEADESKRTNQHTSQ
jgi:hypothetical protein